MKGLLYKDFVTCLNSYKRNALLLILTYPLLALALNMKPILSMFPLLLGMYSLTGLTFDEHSHWDTYVRTMPVSRRTVVAAKYLLGLAFILGGAVVSLATMSLVDLLNGSLAGGFAENVCSILLLLAMALVYYAIAYPLSYKVGGVKARSWVLLVVAGLVSVIYYLSFLDPDGTQELLAFLSGMSSAQVLLLSALMSTAGLLVYAASGWLSLLIYRQKEF